MKTQKNGRLILLNGASSAGKSTLCKALREKMPEPFLHYSLDLFIDGDILPKKRDPANGFSWAQMREPLIEGFYRCLVALMESGNNVIADIIIESEDQKNLLQEILKNHRVFKVGVHCPLEELIRRERSRGDRSAGGAETDFKTVHTFIAYDFEVDSMQSPDTNADLILRAFLKQA